MADLKSITLNNLDCLEVLLDLINSPLLTDMVFNTFLQKTGLGYLSSKKQVELINRLINIVMRLPIKLFGENPHQRYRVLDGLRQLSRQRMSQGAPKVGQPSIESTLLKPKRKIIEYC